MPMNREQMIIWHICRVTIFIFIFGIMNRDKIRNGIQNEYFTISPEALKAIRRALLHAGLISIIHYFLMNVVVKRIEDWLDRREALAATRRRAAELEAQAAIFKLAEEAARGNEKYQPFVVNIDEKHDNDEQQELYFDEKSHQQQVFGENSSQ